MQMKKLLAIIIILSVLPTMMEFYWAFLEEDKALFHWYTPIEAAYFVEGVLLLLYFICRWSVFILMKKSN